MWKGKPPPLAYPSFKGGCEGFGCFAHLCRLLWRCLPWFSWDRISSLESETDRRAPRICLSPPPPSWDWLRTFATIPSFLFLSACLLQCRRWKLNSGLRLICMRNALQIELSPLFTILSRLPVPLQMVRFPCLLHVGFRKSVVVRESAVRMAVDRPYI